MKNEFITILLTGSLMLLLAQCGSIQGPIYLLPEGPKMQEPMTTVMEPPNDHADEPLSFHVPPAVAAAPGEELTSDLATGPSGGSIENYLTYVMTDVHLFWASIMEKGGYSIPFAYYAFPNAEEAKSYETKCGNTEKLDVFYCPMDDQIVVTEEMAKAMWNGTLSGTGRNEHNDAANDFSVALTVAHEYAHSLQAELGWLNDEPLEKGETYQPIVSPTATENHADCLSGVWTQSTYHRDKLKPEHIEAAINLLLKVGDDKLSDDRTHGTSEERVAAFYTGYNSGSASSCDSYLQNAYTE